MSLCHFLTVFIDVAGNGDYSRGPQSDIPHNKKMTLSTTSKKEGELHPCASCIHTAALPAPPVNLFALQILLPTVFGKSTKPELGDHRCLATVARDPSAPHLWTAHKCCVSYPLHILSLPHAVWLHS